MSDTEQVGKEGKSLKQYIVTGMSCAACSARIEKSVSRVPGVTSCSVSLLTNSMGVEGSASAEDIIRAVEEAGYCSGRNVKRYGNTCFEKAFAYFSWVFNCINVFFHGTYDVGLALAGIHGRKSCGYGNFAAAVNRHHYGDQPEILYQRI